MKTTIFLAFAMLFSIVANGQSRPCTFCNGSGKKTSRCITCSGKGYKTRTSWSDGSLETFTCIVCSGRGKTSNHCSVCNGSGKNPSGNSRPIPIFPKDNNKHYDDVLEGKWYSPTGDYYDFSKKRGNIYRVSVYGANGIYGGAGEGYLDSSTNTIYLSINIPQIGLLRSTGALDGNNMTVTTVLWGQYHSYHITRR